MNTTSYFRLGVATSLVIPGLPTAADQTTWLVIREIRDPEGVLITRGVFAQTASESLADQLITELES